MVCVDKLYPEEYATRKHLEAEGYTFRLLSDSGFHSTHHWFLHLFHRSSLIRNVRKLLQEIRPDLLIACTDSDLPARTVIRVANELAIPNLLIVDGLAVGGNPNYRLKLLPRLKISIASSLIKLLNVRGRRGTSGVERILVMNEDSREEIIGHGVDARRVLVVGSPEYDEVARTEKNDCAEEKNRQLRIDLGIGASQPVILFAHQSLFLPKLQEQDMIREMMHAARACDGILLIKFHPRCGENPSQWKAWARQEGFTETEAVFLRDWSPSIDAVRMSAACITVYSTVALEALVLGTPLILINYLNTTSILPYAEKYGAAIAAASPLELREAIVRAVSDVHTRVRLQRNGMKALISELGGHDGRSLERTAQAVLELIRNSGSQHSGSMSERSQRPSGA